MKGIITRTFFIIPNVSDADANVIGGAPRWEPDVVADLIGSAVALVLVARALPLAVMLAETIRQKRELSRVEIDKGVEQIRLVSATEAAPRYSFFAVTVNFRNTCWDLKLIIEEK